MMDETAPSFRRRLDEIDGARMRTTLEGYALGQQEQIKAARARISELETQLASFDMAKIKDAESLYFRFRKQVRQLSLQKVELSRQVLEICRDPSKTVSDLSKQQEEREDKVDRAQLKAQLRAAKFRVGHKQHKLILAHESSIQLDQQIKRLKEEDRALHRTKREDRTKHESARERLRKAYGELLPAYREQCQARGPIFLQEVITELQSRLYKKNILAFQREKDHKQNLAKYKELIQKAAEVEKGDEESLTAGYLQQNRRLFQKGP